MRLSSLIQLATLLAVAFLLLVGQGLQPQAGYSQVTWVSAAEAANYANYIASEAASSMSEAASSVLGLQDGGEDPNAAALAGFRASQAVKPTVDAQLEAAVQAAAAAAAGQPAPVRPAAAAAAAEIPPPPPLPPPSMDAAGAPAVEPAWLRSDSTALMFNMPARRSLSAVAKPAGTTLHFTFGSAVMMDFVKNWLHFVRRAGIGPYLVGASDVPLLEFCNNNSVAAAAIIPELDVWTHTRKAKGGRAAYELKSGWQYYRHHNSDFLEMGLVKVAFLWELVTLGFDVLISDLDVVWLNGHWQRWMTWDDPLTPPVPEAALAARADILVSTDELSIANDLRGGRPHELNTGVLRFRGSKGALAMLGVWRGAMTRMKGRKDLTENVNDQALFNQIVHGGDVTSRFLESLPQYLRERGRELPYEISQVRDLTSRSACRPRGAPPISRDLDRSSAG
eukprot:Transcript_25326.p1 GENE.Transcript_25326~~Transcript_25326.p1  ORF type:complete len:470 (+),score=180.70 Transcript_25326:59-1411(+)